MNTQLAIKNFRVFDENGVRIDIKPLTILTGCNSSGKSSIVKAAFLLNSFMKQVNIAIENGEEIELSKYKIDFTGYPNNLLGRFDKVIPFGSSSQKLSLGYTIHSCMLSKDVDIELVFAADKNDDLNNAYLTSISMSTDEGVFYYSDKEKGNSFNLNVIKNYLSSFVEAMIRVEDYYSLYTLPIGEEFGITEEEIDRQKDIIVPQLRKVGRYKVMDVVKYIRFKKKTDYVFKEADLTILDWTTKNDSFFNIPILNYLHTIKKEDIGSVIESEMIPDGKNNTYLADRAIVLSASNKVLNDFIASPFSTFDAYFKDFEHRFFEKLISESNNCPCLATIPFEQKYFQDHPNSGWGMKRVFLFDDEEEKELKKQQEEEEKKPLHQKIKEWEERPLTFDILYQVVMLWNEKYAPGNTDYFNGKVDTFEVMDCVVERPGVFHHYAFDMLSKFAESLIHEVMSITGFENMSYVSSSRATVKKLYALDEKDDFTELLQRYFEAKRLFVERKSYQKPIYKANTFINKWIKEFGIGEFLSFQLDEEGLGVKIFLHKAADDKGHLLADEGYGITQLISILLQVETAILTANDEKANNVFRLDVFDKYDTDVFHFEENTIAIEEPEIHLHPSYQSKLAEMFAEAYRKYNIHFIIETHSEYLIRKLQTFVAHKKIESIDVSICYVYSKDDYVSPSDSRVKHLPIKEDGNLADSFGTGFFDEADNLSVELMSLKMDKS